nr:hypothetical protein BaRGS_022733 [Batillaria attramentaria]
MHYVARALFIFLSSLELMVGVTGNWLLLVVLVRRRSLRVRSFHNLFIANLAMADLLALAYWLPYFVVDLVMEHRLVLDKDHCAANGFVIITSRVVSILSLMGISLNRYLHVCYHHLYSRVFTLPRTIVCCLALWILGLALALPPLLGVGSYDYNNNTHTCSFDRGPSNVYLATVVSVLRQKERAREEAFIRSLCVVFILILISIFPFGVITTISSALPGSIPTEVAVLSVLLYYFNCSVNWIVYGVMNRSFRRGYVMHVKRVLGTCCRCPCDRVFGEKLNISTDSIDNEFERSAHSTEHASQV